MSWKMLYIENLNAPFNQFIKEDRRGWNREHNTHRGYAWYFDAFLGLDPLLGSIIPLFLDII